MLASGPHAGYAFRDARSLAKEKDIRSREVMPLRRFRYGCMQNTVARAGSGLTPVKASEAPFAWRVANWLRCAYRLMIKLWPVGVAKRIDFLLLDGLENVLFGDLLILNSCFTKN
ncbi:MAG: hypothetical protein EA384_00095 [Spirochaetaceae bacterium]|nr:MAG: hypothetical protein EA384_00095 [Spirochaetaceae bacterium]